MRKAGKRSALQTESVREGWRRNLSDSYNHHIFAPAD